MYIGLWGAEANQYRMFLNTVVRLVCLVILVNLIWLFSFVSNVFVLSHFIPKWNSFRSLLIIRPITYGV